MTKYDKTEEDPIKRWAESPIHRDHVSPNAGEKIKARFQKIYRQVKPKAKEAR